MRKTGNGAGQHTSAFELPGNVGQPDGSDADGGEAVLDRLGDDLVDVGGRCLGFENRMIDPGGEF